MVLHQLKHAFERVWGCICCGLFIGPILLIVGIYFVVSSLHDTRADNIASYNNAVSDWTNNYYADFKDASFWYESSISSHSGTKYEDDFHGEDPQDTLSDSPNSGETFLTYSGWYYSLGSSSIFFNSAYFGTQYLIDVYAGSGDSHLVYSDELYPYNDEYVSVSCTSDEESHYSSYWGCLEYKCESYGSSYYWDHSNDKCYREKWAHNFCLKVETSSSTLWTKSTWNYPGISSSSYGCYYENYNTLSYRYYSPSSYVITGEIRSVHDPFVAASFITSGTYNFGLTQAEKATLGLAFLAIGGAITFVVCGAVIWAVKCASGYTRI